MSMQPSAQQVAFLQAFNSTRRMRRNPEELYEAFKGMHGLPHTAKLKLKPAEIYGINGDYFVGENDSVGVLDYNKQPLGQPGLWCGWGIEQGRDGDFILTWDGAEKFYDYIEWLKYLIKHFYAPWGILLNGEIEWGGEERSDVGTIVVVDNVVTTK